MSMFCWATARFFWTAPVAGSSTLPMLIMAALAKLMMRVVKSMERGTPLRVWDSVGSGSGLGWGSGFRSAPDPFRSFWGAGSSWSTPRLSRKV